MSFVPVFAPDAKSQWQELEPVLQELVLDELESLLLDISAQARREFYHDFLYEDDHAFHYVFLRLHVDPSFGTVTVAGVVRYQRRKGN